ncbi:MAG: right-handed parallel beta-helix repeat-containing protein [Phycisphaerales bacterium]|nr:right-handed parallel beta-helix repeat-containing protein [Phycisphaerales bacterium]
MSVRLRSVWCLLIMLVMVGQADAISHLVQPGERWDKLSEKLKAGDEILLLPGQHRSAELIGVIGTLEAPIVIRSLDPERPAVILADRVGITLRRCKSIIIEQLLITGARNGGIVIDDGDDVSLPPSMNDAPSGGHIVRNVAINRTGPDGPRHAITIRAQRGVVIEHCMFQGWGGAGVWIGHSEEVTVKSCYFKRLEGHAQDHGIYICGGSADVRIVRNFFDDAGTYAIKVGDRLRESEFGTRLLSSVQPGTLFDAEKVIIEQNVITGSECAISMSHTDRCHVRSNTISAPRQIAFSLMHNHLDPRFGGHNRDTLSSNLIVTDITPAPRAIVVLQPLKRVSVAVGVNLWWSPDIETWRETLAVLPVEGAAEQMTEMDPELDIMFAPQRDDAQMFGSSTEGVPLQVRAASADDADFGDG